MNDKILLFIPMYNCEKQITRVLRQINSEVENYISEVIVVNNRSTDAGEQAVVDYLEENIVDTPVKVLRNTENYGLGGSHKVAFDYAIKYAFDYVIVLHGDDQGDISNLMPYLRHETYKKYDCLLGARFMRGSKLQGYSLFRTLGNHVYDLLFSLVVRDQIYDLGSGLNMYRVSALADRFYQKYPDNLVFNYCMILGSAGLKLKTRFFPILWREDDQVSNVKMLSQAVKVLKLLIQYAINKKAFMDAEHRDRIVDCYTADVVYDSLNRSMVDCDGAEEKVY